MVSNIQPLIPRDTKTHVAHGTLKRPNPTRSDKSMTDSDQHQNRERKGNMGVGTKILKKEKKNLKKGSCLPS